MVDDHKKIISWELGGQRSKQHLWNIGVSDEEAKMERESTMSKSENNK